jgi:hypothetical protein
MKRPTPLFRHRKRSETPKRVRYSRETSSVVPYGVSRFGNVVRYSRQCFPIVLARMTGVSIVLRHLRGQKKIGGSEIASYSHRGSSSAEHASCSMFYDEDEDQYDMY